MFLDFFLHAVTVFVAEKEALEKRVKELEDSLASKNTEAEKVAEDAAAREAEFVNRAAFLTQNVRRKKICILCTLIQMFVGLCLLWLHGKILYRSGTSPSACGFVEWQDVTRRSYERAGRVHCAGSRCSRQVYEYFGGGAQECLAAESSAPGRGRFPRSSWPRIVDNGELCSCPHGTWL